MDFCLAIEIRVKKLPEHTDHSMSQRNNRSYTANKTFKICKGELWFFITKYSVY